MAAKKVDRAELRRLHAALERLQDDVEAGRWIWNQREKSALVAIMDAIKDTYSLLPSVSNDNDREDNEYE